MRFSFHADDLKSAIERVMSVTKGKSSFPFASAVLIEADKEKNMLRFEADNAVSSVSVALRCSHIQESGFAILDRAIVKRLYSLSGFVEYYSETGVLCGKGEKKAVKIPVLDTTKADFWPEHAAFSDQKQILFAEKDEFLDTFENMIPFVSYDEARPVYTGVHFDASEHRISAVDGYHMLTREISYTNGHWEFSPDGAVTIPVIACKELKTIAGNESNTLSVSLCDKKYIVVSGVDFTYTIRNLEGEFLNVSRSIGGFKKCQFILETKELLSIVKEYESCNDKDEPMPMALVRIGDRFYTHYRHRGYETCDAVSGDVGTLPDDFIKGYNPLYMKHAAELFRKLGASMIAEDDGISNCSTVFTCEDYKCLVLPVRIKEDVLDLIKSYIVDTLAA